MSARDLFTRFCPLWVLMAIGFGSVPVLGQTDSRQVTAILKDRVIAQNVGLFQLKQYLLGKVTKPPTPASAEAWTAEAKRLKEHLLNDVAFHGWPKEWTTGPAKFEDLGMIESGPGYRMRKLRYEIVPGFQSTAILYEPADLKGKVPAILNVNGHVGAPGKSVEYKQKRCINFAKRGMLALNLEWLSFGELGAKENTHWFGGHLDLVGANELGLFVLAMRKGLDFLFDHPNADRSRLGMTGLSGGGWQTIILSALDDRVQVSVPVAGFSSFTPRIEVREYGDLGDVEQSATDLLDGQDYAHLVALRAPRPTLLSYNAEDDCCFRAELVKPLIFEAIRPIFKLYGKEELLQWHENRDPGTHNYLLDNRLSSYEFFTRHFGLPVAKDEIPVDSEIKSYEELVVGLPEDNLTILSLAKRLAQDIRRPPIPTSSEGRPAWRTARVETLKKVVRPRPVSIRRAWSIAVSKNKGLETKSIAFEMDNGLSASTVWLKAIEGGPVGSASIVLNDEGKGAAGPEVSDRVNRGEQVLAADLLFLGDGWTDHPAYAFEQMVHGLGERALGLQVAQLMELSRWLRQQSGAKKVRLETSGIRTQVIGLVAAALDPELYSEVVSKKGMNSLGYLLEKPVEYHQAAELFCLDLYKEFDLNHLVALAMPTKIIQHDPVERSAGPAQ
ncbi:MAG: hypothetical protein AB1898_22550 [Acidobacteriota bacterium]